MSLIIYCRRFLYSVNRFNQFARSILFQYCFGFFSRNFWKVNRLKISARRPIINKTTITSSCSPPPPWVLLPDDILRIILKNMRIGDRIRSKLVCKSWEQILTEHDIPKMPEAWKILYDDFSHNEIRFKSQSEQRIYRFRLPHSIRKSRDWQCCGSCRGWLLIALGNMDESMFLWQPLSGKTQKLPPLLTDPYFNERIYRGTIVDLSVIRRVEIFSVGSIDCIVAVLLFSHSRGTTRVALCTPHEETWKIVGDENYGIIYVDMLFHSTNKRLLIFGMGMQPLQDEYFVLMKNCCIPVSIISMPAYDEFKYVVPHFVESSLTHRLLFVFPEFDRLEYSRGYGELLKFKYPTTKFKVASVAVEDLTSLRLDSEIIDLKEVRSIGEETIFLGETGSLAIPVRVDDVCKDGVYFANAYSSIYGFYPIGVNYYVCQRGLFSLQHNRMRKRSLKFKYRSRFKVGWFMAQL